MKIVFFGVGAVGSVMAQTYFELFSKSSFTQAEFIFVVRDKNKVLNYFFNKKDLLQSTHFIEVDSFQNIFDNTKNYFDTSIDVIINTSTPNFNQQILQVATELQCNYIDLASDIYNKKTLQTFCFEQQSYNDTFSKNNTLGLINLGISPGITNFLIAHKLYSFDTLPFKTTIEAINLNLLENIVSNKIVFSWSPRVAIEEISHNPCYIENKEIKTIEPFSEVSSYNFAYFDNSVELYPIFQEEIISLKQHFSSLENIKMSVGGNEIELMKNLYQLNLLSNNLCFDAKEKSISINEIIQQVVPSMKSPEIMESYIKDNTIKYAQFSAIADIKLAIDFSDEKQIDSTESIGLTFNRYHELLNTPYSGSTYISYPTGVGAAILSFYALTNKNTLDLKGIQTSEYLAYKFDKNLVDIIKRELTHYKISIINTLI